GLRLRERDAHGERGPDRRAGRRAPRDGGPGPLRRERGAHLRRHGARARRDGPLQRRRPADHQRPRLRDAGRQRGRTTPPPAGSLDPGPGLRRRSPEARRPEPTRRSVRGPAGRCRPRVSPDRPVGVDRAELATVTCPRPGRGGGSTRRRPLAGARSGPRCRRAAGRDEQNGGRKTMKIARRAVTLTALPLALLLQGCRDEDPVSPGPGVEPPPAAGEKVAVITDNITADRTFYADTTYVLSGFIKVANGATLTIQPGTRIVGDYEIPGSSLFILRGSRIIAEGTPDRPIVFTSARPEGERRPGDWGGLI